VLFLGKETGWSEAEILAMPRSRFIFYIEQLSKDPDE
jgi:hypothetical protein